MHIKHPLRTGQIPHEHPFPVDDESHIAFPPGYRHIIEHLTDFIGTAHIFEQFRMVEPSRSHIQIPESHIVSKHGTGKFSIGTLPHLGIDDKSPGDAHDFAFP